MKLCHCRKEAISEGRNENVFKISDIMLSNVRNLKVSVSANTLFNCSTFAIIITVFQETIRLSTCLHYLNKEMHKIKIKSKTIFIKCII